MIDTLYFKHWNTCKIVSTWIKWTFKIWMKKNRTNCIFSIWHGVVNWNQFLTLTFDLKVVNKLWHTLWCRFISMSSINYEIIKFSRYRAETICYGRTDHYRASTIWRGPNELSLNEKITELWIIMGGLLIYLSVILVLFVTLCHKCLSWFYLLSVKKKRTILLFIL